MAKTEERYERYDKEKDKGTKDRGKGKGRGRNDRQERRPGRNKPGVGNNIPSGNEHHSRDNDFGWYNTIPELTRAAARFPFSRPLGTSLTITSENKDAQVTLKDHKNDAIPGAMFIHWSPTIGTATSGISPVNTVAREIYSFVRHANSGSANYDPNDLMIYLLAQDSIYSMYQSGVRAYGLMMMYTKENRYMPKTLIEGLGYDYDNLKGNLAQFRWALNQVCYKISSFAVPNFMSYYLRHLWMNTGVYTDKEGAKAQMYAYVQDTVFQYQNSLVKANLGGLKCINAFYTKPNTGAHSNDRVLFTVDSWLDFMEELINPILASEDMGIISGDILKAFGSGNLFTVSPVPDDFVVVPSYSPEVLSQIQNLTVTGYMFTPAGFSKAIEGDDTFYTCDIVQTIDGETAEGFLYHNPVFTGQKPEAWPAFGETPATASLVAIDKLVTSDSPEPDEAAVMVSTRLLNTPTVIGKSTKTDDSGLDRYLSAFKREYTCGTEIVTNLVVTYFSEGKSQNVEIGAFGLLFGTADIRPQATLVLDKFSKFDWCPTMPIAYTDPENAQKCKFVGYYQDTNNYTVMTAADLNRLHEAALMSEFYVPQISSGTRKPMA
uniref:Capsid protein n=1 Tax=Picobirnavirus wolf/PRT/189/2015 TaxID=1873469 RepID=A0A1B1LLJ3_9VIRU|nr:capsid protein [Picobirnavirus wolf/PRT/189/2015]ANS53889.1 capsid protein [Picobirnavirus wolf/PRT/189/2015]